MTTTITIPQELLSRTDVTDVVEASARVLEQLDRSAGIGARATWQVTAHPQGGLAACVTVEVREWAFTASLTCPLDDLADKRQRELRLSRFYDHVLQHQVDRLIRRTNELIAEAEEEETAQRVAH